MFHDPTLVYSQIHSRDANMAARALLGWKQEYDQLDGGEFCSSLEHISGAGMQLFRECFNLPVSQSATMPDNCISVVVPLDLSAQGNSDQARNICANGITLLPYEGDVFWVCGQTSDYVVVSLSVDLLKHLLCDDDLNALMQAQRSYAFNLPVKHLQQLQCLLLSVLNDYRQGCVTDLFSAELQQRSLQHALVGSLLDLYVHQHESGNKEWRPLGNQHHYIVRESIAYISQDENQSAGVLDICKALNVPRRTLNYSFERVTGMAPSRYLRSLRLNRARREILASSEPIGTIAERFGFSHAGYFGKEYRQLFGESASQTRLG